MEDFKDQLATKIILKLLELIQDTDIEIDNNLYRMIIEFSMYVQHKDDNVLN